MRGFGEISALCEVARPDIGVVTTVGHSHTERVGGIDGVAIAKSELVRGVAEVGHGGAQRRRRSAWRRWRRTPERTCSRSAGGRRADRATSHSTSWPARGSRSTRRGVRVTWRLAMSGAHMAMQRRGRDRRGRCRRGTAGGGGRRAVDGHRVGDADGGHGRWRPGATIINDAYNANPTSMAPPSRRSRRCSATRRVAVLGLMAELDDPVAAHARDRAVGRRARHRTDRRRHRPLRRRAVRRSARRARRSRVRATSCS